MAHPDWLNIDNSFSSAGDKFLLKCVLSWSARFGLIAKEQLVMKTIPNHYHLNLAKGVLPFHDNEIAYVYTSHFLEHIARAAAEKTLGEVHRVLMPGGVLRIVVPDLERVVVSYLNNPGDNSFHESFPEIENPTWRLNAYFGRYPNGNRKSAKVKLFEALFGTSASGHEHRWMYDSGDMNILLRSVGFENAKKVRFREGTTPNLDYLDTQDHARDSLYMEATK